MSFLCLIENAPGCRAESVIRAFTASRNSSPQPALLLVPQRRFGQVELRPRPNDQPPAHGWSRALTKASTSSHVWPCRDWPGSPRTGDPTPTSLVRKRDALGVVQQALPKLMDEVEAIRRRQGKCVVDHVLGYHVIILRGVGVANNSEAEQKGPDKRGAGEWGTFYPYVVDNLDGKGEDAPGGARPAVRTGAAAGRARPAGPARGFARAARGAGKGTSASERISGGPFQFSASMPIVAAPQTLTGLLVDEDSLATCAAMYRDPILMRPKRVPEGSFRELPVSQPHRRKQFRPHLGQDGLRDLTGTVNRGLPVSLTRLIDNSPTLDRVPPVFFAQLGRQFIATRSAEATHSWERTDLRVVAPRRTPSILARRRTLASQWENYRLD